MARLLPALLVVLALPASAQSPFWAMAPASEAPTRADLSEYQTVRLDLETLRTALRTEANTRSRMTLRIPLPEGGTVEGAVREAPIMPQGLQARHPDVRTYVVRGEVNGRLTMTPQGLSGLLYDAQGAIVIDPLGPQDADNLPYIAVFRPSALRIPDLVLNSITDDVILRDTSPESASARATAPIDEARRASASIGETLRTYRLAVTVRGEYTERRARGSAARALAFITASVNRVNAIFERDLAVRFELVENNDLIVFDDADTDPFTTTGGELLDQAQATIDSIIGDENYDLGHLISFDEGGGLALLGALCDPGFKSYGYSGIGNETTPFDLLVFPHELGHQLGAPHAFVQPSSDFDPQSIGVEPGPGYTIMSYPHFASYRRPQDQVGYHFHGASIDDMESVVGPVSTFCGVNLSIENDVPEVASPDRVVIPPGAFVTLESEASDNSGTPLTYAWEQMDTYGNGTGAIPRVRAFDPSLVSSRTIPDLRRFLDNRPLRDEEPLEPGNVYTFQVTVRDNLGGGGAQNESTTQVRVTNAEDSFEITSVPPDTVYPGGEPVEVTWNVAGTTSDLVGVEAVDVMVSVDNGVTWMAVAENVANDGAETITMPSMPTTEGRLMVSAVGAPFFTVAAEEFEVTGVVSAEDEAAPERVSVSPVWPNPTSQQASIQVRLVEPSALRATVFDALGRTIAVVEDGNALGTVTMRVDLDGMAAGVYLLRVEGTTFVETRRFVVAR
ncbi:MAG: reprolysin-like metallopeptidase [Bacteroidota bacterium]